MSRNALVVAVTLAAFALGAWLLVRQDAGGDAPAKAPPKEASAGPVPFPADLPEAYRPESFAGAVAEAVAACPEAGLSVARVDCAEFPCLAWLDGGNSGLEALTRCPEWTRRFGRGPTATGSFMTDAGPRDYAAVAPSPGGPTAAGDPARFRKRLREGREGLMTAWGGRELTQDEQLDRTIEFLRRRGAPGDAEHADALEAERRAKAP